VAFAMTVLSFGICLPPSADRFQHWCPPCSRARQNTHEMPLKKRHVRELLTEDPSQVVGSQDLTTAEANTLATHIPQTTHPHKSTESHVVAIDARRLEGLTGQPSTQVEACAINASALNLPPSPSQEHQHHNNLCRGRPYHSS
jgi:hypothetical protein